MVLSSFFPLYPGATICIFFGRPPLPHFHVFEHEIHYGPELPGEKLGWIFLFPFYEGERDDKKFACGSQGQIASECMVWNLNSDLTPKLVLTPAII